jgi:response regulator RpfG family c-di-GMP phosphodiesterase
MEKHMDRTQISSNKSLQSVENAKSITILALAKLAEYRDDETGLHLERIRKYTKIIAEEMAKKPIYNGYITSEYIADIEYSSILHDIGKVGIPDGILLKPGKLTYEDFEVIKKHCILGGDILDDIEAQIDARTFLSLGKEIAYHHHEKWNGKGYPNGLKGEETPLSARIVSIADVYDVLTSHRIYKKAYSHQKAKEIITVERECSFDPDVVDCFLNRESDFIKVLNQLQK